MKKYIKPAIENIDVENEAIMGLGSVNDKPGYNESGYEGGYAKRNDFLIEDDNED